MTADELLAQYAAAHRDGGAPPDPAPFVARADPAEREVLAELIDAHLASSSRRSFDPVRFAASLSSPLMRGVEEAALGAASAWPALLPRLRDQARLKRTEVVARLTSELGLGESRREKVGGYYHGMEQGSLPPAGVSSRVVEALARILGASADVLRPHAVDEPAAGATGASPVFARTGSPSAEPAVPAEATAAGAAADGESAWDEVDELFRGGDG